MTWVYWAASSILFFSTLNIIQRVIAVDSKYPRAMSIIFNFWAIVISIIIFFTTGAYKNIVFPSDPQAWFFLFLAVVMYGLFERWRFLSSKLLEASVISIVGNVSVVVAFVGAIFLYSERMTANKLFGAGLILTALILIATANGIRKKIPLRSLAIGITVSVVLGLGWMFDKSGANYFNPSTYSLLVWTLPLIIVYFPYVKIKELKYEITRGSWKVILLAGINVVGYLLQLKAYETGDATRIIPIVQTSTLLTVLAGIVILKEKEHVWRKISAALIALAGVFLLVSA